MYLGVKLSFNVTNTCKYFINGQRKAFYAADSSLSQTAEAPAKKIWESKSIKSTLNYNASLTQVLRFSSVKLASSSSSKHN